MGYELLAMSHRKFIIDNCKLSISLNKFFENLIPDLDLSEIGGG